LLPEIADTPPSGTASNPGLCRDFSRSGSVGVGIE